jgi:Flp pilus assembly protein TadB
MDHQEEKNKYEEFADKMEQTRMEVNKEHNWMGVKHKTDYILEELREKGDSVEFSIIILVLAIPLGIIALIYMYSQSIWLGLLGIMILMLFMVYYRVKMRNIITQNSSFKISQTDQNLSEAEQILIKIKYINSGIEIKKKRVLLIRYFYMLCFPFLLFLGTTLISSGMEGVYLIWSLIFAFVIGSVFWSYYFKPDLEDLEYTQDELLDQEHLLFN